MKEVKIILILKISKKKKKNVSPMNKWIIPLFPKMQKKNMKKRNFIFNLAIPLIKISSKT